MSAFLTDTLVWTGALLALVLLIRRPVASIFGPKAAYALWALPMARLLLPPLVLPAWMAPVAEPALDGTIDAASYAPYEPALHAAAPAIDGTAAQTVSDPSLMDMVASFDWAGVLIPIWLIGAAVFLIRRYTLYFEMRRELLAGARPMGEAGRVRLVETPAADGPVAFGVLDKVIALPLGFMATHDRAARDLALKHELSHHRGHDLICNMLVQPLFALHWFNPLSIMGWRAMRRDQEAACDARVIGHAPRETRAAYAAVIARFATQPQRPTRLALAAPMACPVLGDRSIVQRLRSLTMTDISARRRWSGRMLTLAGALALPLTGSITYAQDEAAAPVAPPAPSAPPGVVAAPLPPAPPAPPEAPEALEGEDGVSPIVRIERTERKVGDARGKATPVERRVIVRNGEVMSAEERAEFESEMADLRKEFGEHGELRRELERELGEGSEFQREMRKQFGENGELQREIRVAVAHARAEAQAAVAAAPVVVQRCRTGQNAVTETATARDGRQRIYVCTAVAMADARKAIATARVDIARARKDVRDANGMSAREREQALHGLEEAERKLPPD